MGDRTCHQVYVYDCPKDQVRAVQEALEDYGWEESPKGGRISAIERYFADELSCGTSGDIATALREAAPGASFVVWEDPKYEWLGEMHAYTPALGEYGAQCDSYGRPVFGWDEITPVLDEAAQAGEDARAALAKAMGRPWLDEWDARRAAAEKQRQARLEARYRKYAVKFVVDTEGMLEATDANLKAALAGCARVPDPWDYGPIRRHVGLYRAEQQAGTEQQS